MADVREREKIAKEIEKRIESIRKKHRALKIGRIEENITLDRYFKPLIEPLQLFVDSPGVRATKRESRDKNATSVPKYEKKEEEELEMRPFVSTLAALAIAIFTVGCGVELGRVLDPELGVGINDQGLSPG